MKVEVSHEKVSKARGMHAEFVSDALGSLNPEEQRELLALLVEDITALHRLATPQAFAHLAGEPKPYEE